STAPIPVDEAPGYSQTLGARIPGPEGLAVPQEAGAGQAVSEAEAPYHSTRQNRNVEGQFEEGFKEPEQVPAEPAARTPPVPPAEAQPSASQPEPLTRTTGIAARVETARRAETGQPEPQAGVGIGAAESVEHGRQLLRQGANPQQAVDDFNKSGAVSAEAMALVRAKHEELAKTANQAFDKGGLNDPEFKRLEQERQDWWQNAVKPMQTAWSNTGKAQQGETAIDTGTFYGLYRGFKDKTGREPTASESQRIQQLSQRSGQAEISAADAEKRLIEVLDKASGVKDLSTELQKSINRLTYEAR